MSRFRLPTVSLEIFIDPNFPASFDFGYKRNESQEYFWGGVNVADTHCRKP